MHNVFVSNVLDQEKLAALRQPDADDVAPDPEERVTLDKLARLIIRLFFGFATDTGTAMLCR